MADLAPQLPEPERWPIGGRPARAHRRGAHDWPQPMGPPDRSDDRASDPYRTRLPSFAAVVARPSWHARASCRGQTAVFFPEHGDATEAQAICADCPVQAPCAQASGTEDGVWAGLSKRQRKNLRALLRSQETP
jgi:Transcription factor WhiB